ncbi:MAG: protein translocase SEC61 complex subunit gamma [Acidilobaceae archaeon]|nr:protein translocase SEC61 complex subunit gamma [Acidilobaceae archaeon]MCX8165085.1 protein translocase SEC61 complex subunit gamma [Acidilobaceae archaeon]MDW7974398.1 protein translocase SEC61 complex subunit gamma [Sulfolobales archaeon]
MERVRGLVTSWRRIVALSRKPDSEEYTLLLKLVLIAFGLVGLMGYTIHMIYVLLTSSG